MKLGPLTVTIGKQAEPRPSSTPSMQPHAGVSWDQVKTTDLTDLARRVVNEDLGPGVPITPVHPEKTEPRLFDYTPGYNIAITPRTFEDIQFPALRALSRSWDIATLCIQRNIDDLRQLRWEVRPKAVPGMDRDAVKSRKQRLESTRAGVEGFWMTPDQTHSWSSWVHDYFLSMYETDSACLYLETALDGSLYAVQNVDGTTIAPLVDERGRQPRPPEPAYRQIIRGLPWTMYMQDLELPPDQRTKWFDTAHMVYEPFWGRPDSPYGHPPMEWIILTVQRALARQVLDFRLFQNGTTAYDYWKMPSDWTETQIASLQEAYDRLQATARARAGLKFMPGGPNSGLEHGFLEPKTEGEEFLLHVACAAYNRSPMEMGFIRSSGGAGLGGKGVAGEQGKEANKGVRAAAYHLKSIIDRITGIWFSPELEIVFPELEDVEDAETRAKAEDIRIRNGSLGIDEARLDRDLDPVGPATPGASNMIFLGTAPPVPVLSLFGEAPSQPTATGGANPPIPSAVPGRATDTAASVAKALGAKHVEYTGDLGKVVHRYLLRSYPAKDVAWALDPAISWRYEPSVKLSDINLARRPGGRNEEKVESISDSVESGASMDPVVLADFGEPKLRIADGFHRTLGAEHAGKDAVPAFVARDIPDKYRATLMGQMQDDSSSVKKADLARWQRKAVRSLRLGKSASVPFESEAIPPETRESLAAALAAAQTPAQVRAMFEVLA
jgi:hypothetical protein